MSATKRHWIDGLLLRPAVRISSTPKYPSGPGISQMINLAQVPNHLIFAFYEHYVYFFRFLCSGRRSQTVQKFLTPFSNHTSRKIDRKIAELDKNINFKFFCIRFPDKLNIFRLFKIINDNQ